MRFCPRCGIATFKDTSQQREGSDVPDEIKGWNWGAFFLGWIWGIGNKVWIALLTLILLVSFIPITYIMFAVIKMPHGAEAPTLILLVSILFIVSIVLGMKGNEWAWRNKKWDSIEHFRRTQRAWAIVGIRLTLTAWLLFGAVVIFANQPHFLGRGSREAAETESWNIQSAVISMMIDQGLSALTTPQTTPTNNMNDFPTPNTGNTSAEYVLYSYNGTTNYVVTQYTWGTYVVDANGTVTQVTTGYGNVDRPITPMKVVLLAGLIILLGVEVCGLVYRIRIKKELSEEMEWWKSGGNIAYQLSTILWTALLLLIFLDWATDINYGGMKTLHVVILLVIVFGITIADGIVIYKVERE